MKKSIPTYIIEEHHEAFIVWHDSINKNYISPTNNILLHVDEHSDMGTPRFNQSIHTLQTPGDISKFTYDELGIASFIMPACYKGIFTRVYWIKQKHEKLKLKPVKMSIRSYNQAGKKLISLRLNKNTLLPNDSDRHIFNYYLIDEQRIPIRNSVILDIDLDYFSCAGDPNQTHEIQLEITHKEFDHFKKNKYHRLNYIGLGNIKTIESAGKYYYVFNDYTEIYPSKLKADNNTILQRIDSFVNNLKIKNIRPKVIDICRSRYSGYTPEDQWEFIEKNLLHALDSLYHLEIINWEK